MWKNSSIRSVISVDQLIGGRNQAETTLQDIKEQATLIRVNPIDDDVPSWEGSGRSISIRNSGKKTLEKLNSLLKFV
jgi:hypothetical protein